MSESKQSQETSQNNPKKAPETPNSPESQRSPESQETRDEVTERGFKVVDRRDAGREEPPSSSAASATPEQPGEPEPAQERDKAASQDQSSPSQERTEARARPPVDFSTLLLSFASTALIQLGAASHPDTGETLASPEMARETIDILVMLREKTKGNLSDDESRLFDAILHDLRMKFVSLGSGGKV